MQTPIGQSSWLCLCCTEICVSLTLAFPKNKTTINVIPDSYLLNYIWRRFLYANCCIHVKYRLVTGKILSTVINASTMRIIFCCWVDPLYTYWFLIRLDLNSLDRKRKSLYYALYYYIFYINYYKTNYFFYIVQKKTEHKLSFFKICICENQ